MTLHVLRHEGGEVAVRADVHRLVRLLHRVGRQGHLHVLEQDNDGQSLASRLSGSDEEVFFILTA